MQLSKTNLSALSRLFSSGVFKEMAETGRSPLFARLFRQSGLTLQDIPNDTVSCAFDTAFSVLRRAGHRDEYVYRAALTHRTLLGKHSLNTASMLTEFRAGTSKADLVILNGTSTVYEIKSDRDSLARLSAQLENYRKVFARIYVICGEAHKQEVLNNTSTDIGVLSLARWDRISTIREAEDRASRVSTVAIFESLRISEAKAILDDLKIAVPDLPNTQIYSALKEIFAKLEPEVVHACMVRTLKKTRNLSFLSELISELPESLQPVALSVPLHHLGHERLVKAVQTPLHEAVAWT